MGQKKRKIKGGGRKAKGKSREFGDTFELENPSPNFASAHARTLEGDILHLEQKPAKCMTCKSEHDLTIRKFISKDILVRLYKAYVLPHLEYCSALLLGVGNAETTKIEATNYFILRTILGYSKSVSYDFLLKMADIKSLKKRRQFQSLVMLYRCLYDKGAPYISEFFNFKDVQYNLRGLSTRLDLPPFNLEFMHRSFTFLASKLWNALPPKVRESQDIASFKRSLKAHMA